MRRARTLLLAPFAAAGMAAALAAVPASAQDGGKAELDRLKAAPVPGQQRDLDTMALAAAHRERANSVEERTTGLWQSWLVSVCEGCGADRRPYSDRDAQELMRRAARDTAARQGERERVGERPAERAGERPVERLGQKEQAPEKERKYVYFPPERPGRASASGSLYDDLSTGNIDQIRRDPNR